MEASAGSMHLDSGQGSQERTASDDPGLSSCAPNASTSRPKPQRNVSSSLLEARSTRKLHWSQQDEMTLALRHSQFGNRWSAISKYLPGRTDNDLKNLWHSTLRAKSCRRSSLLFNYVQLVRDCPDDPSTRRAAYDKAMHMTYGGGGGPGAAPNAAPSPRRGSGAQSPLPRPLSAGGAHGPGSGVLGQTPSLDAAGGSGLWEMAGLNGPERSASGSAYHVYGNSGSGGTEAGFGMQGMGRMSGHYPPNPAAAAGADGGASASYYDAGGGPPRWRLPDPLYPAPAGGSGSLGGQAGSMPWRPNAFTDGASGQPASFPRPVEAACGMQPPHPSWQNGALVQPRPSSQPQALLPQQHMQPPGQLSAAGREQQERQYQHHPQQAYQQPSPLQPPPERPGYFGPGPSAGLPSRALSAPVGIPFVSSPPSMQPQPPQPHLQQPQPPSQPQPTAHDPQSGHRYPPDDGVFHRRERQHMELQQQRPQERQPEPTAPVTLKREPSHRDASPFRFPQTAAGPPAPERPRDEPGWGGLAPPPAPGASWRQPQSQQQGTLLGRIGAFCSNSGADGGGAAAGGIGGVGAGAAAIFRRPPLRQSTAPGFVPPWMQPQPQQADQPLPQLSLQQLQLRPRPLSSPVGAVAAAAGYGSGSGMPAMHIAQAAGGMEPPAGPSPTIGWQRLQQHQAAYAQQPFPVQQYPQALQSQQQQQHAPPGPNDRIDVTLGDLWLPPGGAGAGAVRDGDTGIANARGGSCGGGVASGGTAPAPAAPSATAAASPDAVPPIMPPGAAPLPSQAQPQPQQSMLSASLSEPAAGCADLEADLAMALQWRTGAAGAAPLQPQPQHPLQLPPQHPRLQTVYDPLDELMDELDRAQASGGLLQHVKQVAARAQGGPMSLSMGPQRPMGHSDSRQQQQQEQQPSLVEERQRSSAASQWAARGDDSLVGAADDDSGLLAAPPSFSQDWMAQSPPAALQAARPGNGGGDAAAAQRMGPSRGAPRASRVSDASMCTDAVVTLGLGDEDLSLCLGSLGALG